MIKTEISGTRRSRPVQPADSAKGSLFTFAGDLLVLAIATASPFVVKVGGDLSLAQLLIIPLLPILLFAGRHRLRSTRLRTAILLVGLWLCGEIVADLYHRSEFQDWIRGDARIVFMGADLLALATLIGGRKQRHMFFYAGLAAGYILQVRLQPNEYTDFWKFGYATGVTLAVVLVSCYFYRQRRFVIVLLLLAGISAVHAALNFRSPILVLFITSVLVLPIIPERVGQMRILPASWKAKLLVKVSLALIAGKAASSLVLFLGVQGYLGEDARQKDLMQARAKGGMLLGGRPEILVSSRAVMDSPIIGHGSWAKDFKYTEMYSDLLVKYDIVTTEGPDEERSDLIPTHSHLMDAWVDAGIVGAVFWIYILSLALRAIARSSSRGLYLAPVYCFSLIGFVWSILFSPSGSVSILPDSFFIIVSCDLMSHGEPSRSRYTDFGK